MQSKPRQYFITFLRFIVLLNYHDNDHCCWHLLDFMVDLKRKADTLHNNNYSQFQIVQHCFVTVYKCKIINHKL